MSNNTLKELLQRLIRESFEGEGGGENQEDNSNILPNDESLSREAEKILPNLSDTNEREILPFAAKYSMLNVSPNEFILDMITLYQDLSLQGFSSEEIVKTLMPENKDAVKDFYTFFTKLIEYIRSKDGEEVVTYQIPDEVKKDGEAAARRYLDPSQKDAKAIISYEFSKNSLTPRGFWQLQFFARILANKPFLPEEEVIFSKKINSQMVQRAYDVLRDFYKHAFVKMAVQIAGRFHKQKELTQSDVRLQTDIDVSVDQFISGIATGKYNVSRNNVGAWAFTVMKNKLIDFIKELTSVTYRTGIDTKTGINTYDAFVQNNFSTWYSTLDPKKADIPEEDLAEPVQKVKLNSGELAYQYKFTSPEVAHSYLQGAEQGEANNIFKHLTKGGQRKLMNIGAKLHTRKDANFHPDTQTDPVIPGEKEKEEKGLNLLEYNLYIQLFDFAFKHTPSFDTAFGEKSVFNVDNIVDVPRSQARTFKVDIGKALFAFLGYFDYTYTWKRKAKGKFNPQEFNEIIADRERIDAAKKLFKETNEAMYFAILGWEKGLDWTKLNNVAIGKRNQSGELTGIVDTNYVDENGDVYEELLPLTKTVISRSRKGVVSREIEQEINNERELSNKQPFNSGQLQSISSAAKQMEDLIKIDPKLTELIKRILKAKQQKNQTLNEMKENKIRSLVRNVLKEWFPGEEDSYEMDDDFLDNPQSDTDIEDDITDNTLEKKPTGSGSKDFAAAILAKDDIDQIASSIVKANESVMYAIAEELHKMKASQKKKFAAITDRLVSAYQSGVENRQILNFFMIYYLGAGESAGNSVLNVLKKVRSGIETEKIYDVLSNAIPIALEKYKATGNSIDDYLFMVSRNAVNKMLDQEKKTATTSLDAPLSDKGSKTKGDMLGGEDGDMTGGDEPDATDTFGADNKEEEEEEEEETSEEKESRLNQALQGTRENIIAFKKALKIQAEKYPNKWKKYLLAFENIWQKGNSWNEEFGKTINWSKDKYDLMGTGKKLLIEVFIIPELESDTVQELKKMKQREGGAWEAFNLSKGGTVLGLNQDKFNDLRTRVAAIKKPHLDKIMSFLADEEGSHLDLREIDPKKVGLIVQPMQKTFMNRLTSLAKDKNIEIKNPVSAIRKLKRNVQKGNFSQDHLDHVTNIDEDATNDGFIADSITSEDIEEFNQVFSQIKAKMNPLNETYIKMQSLLNNNKLAR